MIHSVNEWDRLRRVVVGSATSANWPISDPVFSQESKKTTWQQSPVPRGPVDQQVIDETNQDLDALVSVFQSLDIEVVRPDPFNFQAHDGMYNYCPRDRLLIYGDTVVDPAMMYPCRDMELQCYRDIVDSATNYLHMPRHEGMIMDAANVLKLNDHMLFLESASGNRKAYEWLCRQFPTVNIELCNFYSGVHIDSTITPLREGVVVLNASRVNENNCPEVFKNWEKIYINDVIEQDFYQYPYASKWIALNMLVIDPNTVICDKKQHGIIQKLEKYNFNVIPLELRHSRTLGGGFHCVTLDLWRQHD